MRREGNNGEGHCAEASRECRCENNTQNPVGRDGQTGIKKLQNGAKGGKERWEKGVSHKNTGKNCRQKGHLIVCRPVRCQSTEKLAYMPINQRKMRVVIVDDHPMVRQGIAAMIEVSTAMEVVGEAAGQREAVEVIGRVKPTLVTLDMTLKEGDGLRAAREISERFPDVKILMLSMHSEQVYGPRAAAAGASGYLMKEEAADKITEGLGIVAGGGRYFSASVEEEIKRTPRRAGDSVAGTVTRLSNRELQVYQLIAQGVSTRNIAERLNVTVKTVESYRKLLRTKFNLSTGLELTVHAMEHAGLGKV